MISNDGVNNMEKDFSKYNDIAEVLKVLAHPVRICIVKGLIDKGECNVSHMQECLEVPQSTVSQHLQKLRSAGIIEGTRNGLEINYRIADPVIVKVIKALFE